MCFPFWFTTAPLFSLQFPSFSLFYRYCTELSQCVLSSLMGACNIRQAILSHSYSVHHPYARNNQYSQTYKYTTSQFWNTLPTSICPSYYGLTYSTSYAMCLDTSKVLGHNLYFFSRVGTLMKFLTLSSRLSLHILLRVGVGR